MNTQDIMLLAQRLNIWFLAISISFLEFCFLIFPALRDDFQRLGATVSPVTDFSFAQCSFVERNPSISLAVFAIYYLLSLKAIRADTQGRINLGLLIYFAFILFGIGAPLYGRFQ
jgi:hypothetical protein